VGEEGGVWRMLGVMISHFIFYLVYVEREAVGEEGVGEEPGKKKGTSGGLGSVGIVLCMFCF
jgi:hypothetical protein